MDDILRRISLVAAATFGCDPAEFTEHTVAHDVAGWDSLTHVYFIVAIEHEFGLRFPTANVINLACVGDLVKLIRRQEGEI